MNAPHGQGSQAGTAAQERGVGEGPPPRGVQEGPPPSGLREGSPPRGVHEREQPVRFAHCDLAGIVFFPQYLVMLNELVEDWFDRALRIPYAGIVGEHRTGLPTVRLEVDFSAISRHGDLLRQRLSVLRLGRSSLELQAVFERGGEACLSARQVLVCTSLDTHRAQPWPADLRAAIEGFGHSEGARP